MYPLEGLSSLKNGLPKVIGAELDFRHKSAGIISEIYMMLGWNRIVTICNHESTEDLVRVLSTLPLSSFLDREVYPLADINESMNALIEGAKNAEKLFPEI